MHKPVNGQRTRYLIAETSIYQKTSTVNKCPQDFSHWSPWQQVKNISNRKQQPSHLQMTGTTPGRFRRNSDLIWRHIPNLLRKLCCEEGKILRLFKKMYLKHKMLQWSNDSKSYSMLIKLDFYIFSRKPSSACPCRLAIGF